MWTEGDRGVSSPLGCWLESDESWHERSCFIGSSCHISFSSEVSEAPWKPPMAPETFIRPAAMSWEGSKDPVKPYLVPRAMVSLTVGKYSHGSREVMVWLHFQTFRVKFVRVILLYLCFEHVLRSRFTPLYGTIHWFLWCGTYTIALGGFHSTSCMRSNTVHIADKFPSCAAII